MVDMPFDQFWVQRLQSQGHNVSILPANYQPDNPGAVTADIFIGSNDIGSGDFISSCRQCCSRICISGIEGKAASYQTLAASFHTLLYRTRYYALFGSW